MNDIQLPLFFYLLLSLSQSLISNHVGSDTVSPETTAIQQDPTVFCVRPSLEPHHGITNSIGMIVRRRVTIGGAVVVSSEVLDTFTC
jgi:hypothetical protein